MPSPFRVKQFGGDDIGGIMRRNQWPALVGAERKVDRAVIGDARNGAEEVFEKERRPHAQYIRCNGLEQLFGRAKSTYSRHVAPMCADARQQHHTRHSIAEHRFSGQSRDTKLKSARIIRREVGRNQQKECLGADGRALQHTRVVERPSADGRGGANCRAEF